MMLPAETTLSTTRTLLDVESLNIAFSTAQGAVEVEHTLRLVSP